MDYMDYKEAIEIGSVVAQIIQGGLSPDDIMIFGSTARKAKKISDVDLFVVDSNHCLELHWGMTFYDEDAEHLPFLQYLFSECGWTDDRLPKLLAPIVDIIFITHEVISSHKEWKAFNALQRDKHFLDNAFKHLLRWQNGEWVPVKRTKLIKEYRKNLTKFK
ncbi:hypothetical protein L6252_01105 [Candidatus Parcubacteria bacterium]|nr:hypothetical protein [Candidatus Parcubacteria bacterium]